MLDGVDFIRSYADRFTSRQEEDILFACFDPDWTSSRRCTRIPTGDARTSAGSSRRLARGNREGVAAHLCRLCRGPSEHIKRRTRSLPLDGPEPLGATVGELFARFLAVDERFSEERIKYESFVGRLEERTQNPFRGETIRGRILLVLSLKNFQSATGACDVL